MKKTLAAHDIATSVPISRRSALRMVAAATTLGLGPLGCHHASRASNCTDSDTGAAADAPGNGRCVASPDTGGSRLDGGTRPDAGPPRPDAYTPPDMFQPPPDAYRPPPDMGHSCTDTDPTDPVGMGIHC
jgi:hypothetical protein